MDVDAVQKGTGDAAEIVYYLQRCAASFLLGMAIKSAGTTMRHRLQTFLNHGKPNIFTFELEINLLEEAGFYKTNPKTLGEYIRKTRLDRKMTIKELAEIIGCSKNILLDWEKDRRIPRLMHLKRLYDVLGVPYEFIRGAIAKNYSLSEKEKDMVFELKLIRENLNGYKESMHNNDNGNLSRFGLLLRI